MEKKKNPFEIAVYGKGGIGKSTVSANLSAALSLEGLHVMQIGCDPKHDSTRLLMHGESIPTVLDYLKDVNKEDGELGQVLKTGFGGIGCIEAGGPRPGVGCAGRGIISAFEFLEMHQAKQDYEIVVYDVLGDVVCGGFAVPVRREYADAVFLVTSGEFMALYAANNILRGIRNYDGRVHHRVAGIIYNERRLTDEDGRVERFAKAVGLPILIKVPRSDAFATAEEQNKTLMELDGCDREKRIFRSLAHRIKEGMLLFEAAPLTDEELERVVLQTDKETKRVVLQTDEETQRGILQTEDAMGIPGTAADVVIGDGNPESGNQKSDIRSLPERPALFGCAFNGAATAAVNLTDAIVIAHSPRACAFYTWQNISSPGRKNLYNRGILMPSAISPNLECTDMDQADVVFGGMDRLREAVQRAMDRRPGAVIIISSCVSGIIGDDIRSLEEMSTRDIPVITIPADGDIGGDYMKGIRMTHEIIAKKLIDTTVTSKKKSINLISETGVSNNREINYRIFKRWMDAMGIEINCRFLGEATVSQMRNFLGANVNVLAGDTADGRDLRKWLENHYSVTFMDGALPIGAGETKKWLMKLGRLFDCEREAEELISGQVEAYEKKIESLKPRLKGKKVFITTINANMDWLFHVLSDLEMPIVYIGVLNYLQQKVKVTEHPEKYRIDENYNGDRTDKLLKELQPDIVISNYVLQPEHGEYVVDAMPMTPSIGFESGIRIVERWEALLKTQRRGGWMNDRAIFEKYFA